MLDLFSNGVSREAFQEVIAEISVNMATIFAILVHKGIVTEDEIAQMKLRVSPQVDQEIQRVKEEAAARWREENPEQAKTADFLNRMLGGT